jgi:hypothetical protein
LAVQPAPRAWVAGLPDDARCSNSRAETLVYEERLEDRDAGALERAIEDAVAQSAEILALRHHAGELAQRGHQIAAVLRF